MQHTCVGMTRKLRFESSVISYGNQTGRIIHGQDERLKVV